MDGEGDGGGKPRVPGEGGPEHALEREWTDRVEVEQTSCRLRLNSRRVVEPGFTSPVASERQTRSHALSPTRKGNRSETGLFTQSRQEEFFSSRACREGEGVKWSAVFRLTGAGEVADPTQSGKLGCRRKSVLDLPVERSLVSDVVYEVQGGV